MRLADWQVRERSPGGDGMGADQCAGRVGALTAQGGVMNRATTITAEQAISVLPDRAGVHTFRNPSGMILGADWPRAGIEDALNAAKTIHLTGAVARSMGHGMVIDHDGLLFIETDEPRIAELESRIAAEAMSA